MAPLLTTAIYKVTEQSKPLYFNNSKVQQPHEEAYALEKQETKYKC